MTARRRFLAAGTALLAITAGAAVSSAPSPASAAVVDAADMAGNFAGDDRDEIFSYVAGSTADLLVSFDNGGVPGGPLSVETHPFMVNGRYDPIVGNFDGDAYDELLWYTPGTGGDFLWNFTSFDTVDIRPFTVNGVYEPVVGDYSGDGVDDILWYVAGPGQDHLWEFDATSYRSIPYSVNGYYTPIPGSFASDATDDVLWYVAGTGADHMWDFRLGTTSYTSTPHPVNGAYLPFVLDVFNDGWQGDDIFWYGPGPTSGDYIWDYFQGVPTVLQDRVNGYYVPVAGDFLGDGHDDIVWLVSDDFSLWDHAPAAEPGVVDRWIYDFSPAAAASTASPSGDVATTGEAVDDVDAPIVARSGGTVERGHG
jgi:hypothetical protein